MKDDKTVSSLRKQFADENDFCSTVYVRATPELCEAGKRGCDALELYSSISERGRRGG